LYTEFCGYLRIAKLFTAVKTCKFPNASQKSASAPANQSRATANKVFKTASANQTRSEVHINQRKAFKKKMYIV